MSTAARPTAPKVMSQATAIAVSALTYLLAAVFLYTSYTKFSGSAASVATFSDIGVGQWLRYVTAGFEVAGAVGLLIPRLTGVAAACLSALLAGAVVSQLLLVTEKSIATPAVLFVVTGILAWIRRDQIRDRIRELVAHIRSPGTALYR